MQQFQKEDSKVLTEELNKNCTSKYNLTLSTVWQLSFQGLQAEKYGKNALMLLRSLSFYIGTVSQKQLLPVHTECPFCPNTPKWMQYGQLRVSIRLLEKFYAADCTLKEINNSEALKDLQSSSSMDSKSLNSNLEQVKQPKHFNFKLRVHRLVKLVVRLQMDCSTVLEDILCLQTLDNDQLVVPKLNTFAFEEALKRSKLTTRGLAFVGLRALQGDMATRRIVDEATNVEVVDPAATIWRMYYLDKDIKTLNTIPALRRLIELIPEMILRDQRCVALVLMPVLGLNEASDTEKFKEIQDLALKLFRITCSFPDECSQPLLCRNYQKSLTASWTEELGKALIEKSTRAELPKSLVDEIRQLLLTYCEEHRERDPCLLDLLQLMEELYKVKDEAVSWQTAITSAESLGLTEAHLTTLFRELFHKMWSASAGKNISVSLSSCLTFHQLNIVVREFLLCRRPTCEILRAIITAYGETVATTEKEMFDRYEVTPDYWIYFAIEVCSTWMFIWTQKDILSLGCLVWQLSHCKVLAEIRKTPIKRLRTALKSYKAWKELRDTHARTYQEFIGKYLRSTEEAFKTLLLMATEIPRAMYSALNPIDSHAPRSSI